MKKTIMEYRNDLASAEKQLEQATCIFREICASVPKERSAIPLETERSSAD